MGTELDKKEILSKIITTFEDGNSNYLYVIAEFHIGDNWWLKFPELKTFMLVKGEELRTNKLSRLGKIIYFTKYQIGDPLPGTKTEILSLLLEFKETL